MQIFAPSLMVLPSSQARGFYMIRLSTTPFKHNSKGAGDCPVGIFVLGRSLICFLQLHWRGGLGWNVSVFVYVLKWKQDQKATLRAVLMVILEDMSSRFYYYEMINMTFQNRVQWGFMFVVKVSIKQITSDYFKRHNFCS